jgi:hypothetical protein
LAIVKQNDKQLLTDAAYFFHEALMLIKNEFKDSKELKLKLFSVYRKLKIKKYKYLIFELKYPYLKPLFFLAIKVRLKLARVFT